LKEVNNLKWVRSVSPDFSLGPKICCQNDKKLTKPDRNQKQQREGEGILELTVDVFNDVLRTSMEKLMCCEKVVGEGAAIGQV
jgi:hypothetical protein